jgi:5'-deoxynucleotidase YfbR-like HD superfamily hydrolase
MRYKTTPPPLYNDVLALADYLLAFARINRATRHPDGNRPETDSDHTAMLSMVAIGLAPFFRLDTGKLAAYATVHDFPEVIAGDTTTIFASTDNVEEIRKGKAEREARAIEILKDDLGDAFPNIFVWIEAYEAQADPESRFIKVLDKVLPKLTHVLNKGASLGSLSSADVRKSHDQQYADLRSRYGEEFPALLKLLLESMHEAQMVKDRG